MVTADAPTNGVIDAITDAVASPSLTMPPVPVPVPVGFSPLRSWLFIANFPKEINIKARTARGAMRPSTADCGVDRAAALLMHIRSAALTKRGAA